MQLPGLQWAGTDSKVLKKVAQTLLAAQRDDGGWSQLPGLESDAYATGQVLVALETCGTIAVTDAAYRRGVDFLLRTQSADGSWLMHSRTFPVQPYKDSGLPHGKDQWIPAPGSSWAVNDLGLTVAR